MDSKNNESEEELHQIYALRQPYHHEKSAQSISWVGLSFHPLYTKSFDERIEKLFYDF